MNESTERLLREYVRSVLKEDGDFGGDAGGGMMGTWGYMDYGPSVKSIFIDPFLDVGKTMMAAGTKVAARSKALVKTGLETALTTFIPFLQSNYKLIFDQEKKELQKIREKYKQVFEANDKAFSSDVMFLSFLSSPSTFLTVKMAQTAPEYVTGVLEVFSHGSENLAQYFQDVQKRLKQIQDDLQDDMAYYRRGNPDRYTHMGQRGTYLTKKKRMMLRKAGIADSHEYFGGRLSEATTDPQQEVKRQQGAYLAQVVQDPRLAELVNASPLSKQMSQDAQRVTQDISRRVTGEAKKVLSSHTLQDLQRMTGKNFGQGLQGLPENERVNVENVFLGKIKEATRAFYTKQLQTEISTLSKQGIGPENLYIKALQNIVKNVASLK